MSTNETKFETIFKSQSVPPLACNSVQVLYIDEVERCFQYQLRDERVSQSFEIDEFIVEHR
jgi:hypothetical protein